MKLRAGCQRDDHPRLGRRALLGVGGLGMFGASLADLSRLEAHAAPERAVRTGRAKSVVFIFQSGGPSQHETFDPKPEAPAEIRGEYGTTATRLHGIRFCEYLPRLAARADKFSIVRTVHHTASREFRNEHNSCMYCCTPARPSCRWATRTRASRTRGRVGSSGRRSVRCWPTRFRRSRRHCRARSSCRG